MLMATLPGVACSAGKGTSEFRLMRSTSLSTAVHVLDSGLAGPVALIIGGGIFVLAAMLFGSTLTRTIPYFPDLFLPIVIGGFGIALSDTLIVEWDGSGAFDLVCGFGDGSGRSHRPLCGADRGARPRSREAFVAATGAMGRAMLQRAEAVGKGEWAGVEG